MNACTANLSDPKPLTTVWGLSTCVEVNMMDTTALLTEERLWGRIEETPNGCWEWQGPRTALGYGRVFLKPLTGRVQVLAHRLVYELLVGPIPTELVIDHLCRNPPCVNPKHLEPVTTRTNLMRGFGPSALAARATHCPSGHPYEGENLWVWKGIRLCRTCKRAQYKAQNERRRRLRV